MTVPVYVAPSLRRQHSWGGAPATTCAAPRPTHGRCRTRVDPRAQPRDGGGLHGGVSGRLTFRRAGVGAHTASGRTRAPPSVRAQTRPYAGLWAAVSRREGVLY